MKKKSSHGVVATMPEGRLDDVPQWFVLRTQPNRELSSALLLSTRFKQYLPTYESRSRWHDRTKLLKRPLFPGYLFAQFAWSRRHEVFSTPGVLTGVIQFGPDPAILSDDEIDEIRDLERNAAIPTDFREGCKVRVLEGALAGRTGTLVSIDNELHIAVEVSILGRMVAVRLTVPDYVVERVA